MRTLVILYVIWDLLLIVISMVIKFSADASAEEIQYHPHQVPVIIYKGTGNHTRIL